MAMGMIEQLVEMEQRRSLGEYALGGSGAPDTVAELERAMGAAERSDMLCEQQQLCELDMEGGTPRQMVSAVLGSFRGAKYNKRKMVVVLKDGTEVLFSRDIPKGGNGESKMMVARPGRKAASFHVASIKGAVKKLKTLTERAVRVPPGFEPSNKIQKALLGLLRRGAKAEGPKEWFRLEKLARAPDLRGIPYEHLLRAAFVLGDYNMVSFKEFGAGKGTAVRLKESLDEMMGAFDRERPKVFIFSSKELARDFAKKAKAKVRGKFSVRKTKGWSTYSVVFAPHSFADVVEISKYYKPEKKHFLDIAKNVKESLDEGHLAELQGYTVPRPGDVGPGLKGTPGGIEGRGARYQVPKPGKVGPRPKKVKKAAYTNKWGKGYIDRTQRGSRGKDILEPVEGYLRGVWGIAKTRGGWNVYHAPTGFMAWSGFDKKADVKKFLDIILDEHVPLRMLGKDAEPTHEDASMVASKIQPYLKKIRAIVDRVKGHAAESTEAYGEQITGALLAAEGMTLAAPQVAEATGLDKALVRRELDMMGRAGMVARTAPAADEWRLTHFGEACTQHGGGKKKRKGKKAPKMMAYEGVR